MQLPYLILGLAALAVLFYEGDSFASLPPQGYQSPDYVPPDYYPDWSTAPVETMSTYDQIINMEANPPPSGLSFGEFVRLINSVIQIESSWDPSAVSSAGAIGLMQVMPANAVAYGYQPNDLYDPAINIKLGTRILRDNINSYGLTDGLAAYNGGPNGRHWASTQAYAQKVLGVYNA